ncbi:MFS transporter [Planctopirus hydrillae]|uniref:MFS transporter n=1 Tax=Planctopirus hydrillae TaxID=1841610 RepID=A0A1C3EDZ8_9PLAN|nr:MFS transporter [Planctopirus hydrillae]ODA31430.1 MFS transporter [Planctopirus hydrillae]
MTTSAKATSIRLWDFKTPPMRAFHMSWFAFFLCFFAWFGIAPLMPVVRDEMHLSKDQVGWCIIGSVAITVLARLYVGWLCDRIGPRLAYSGLLVLASIPVMGIGLAHDFTTFLMFRIAIGAIGASFVITQYHTSIMFAKNCVGTANATTAGWGNLGGGVTQMVMPTLFALLMVAFGLSTASSWRFCMLLAGVVCATMGIAYFFLTQDTPEGNFAELRATGKMPQKSAVKGTFQEACRDYRVWILFLVYGACFGMELTLDNIAALYFIDYFKELKTADPVYALGIAGFVAGLFGSMNLFARALGGIASDRCAAKWALSGRVRCLFIVVLLEGMALMLFSQARTLQFAIPAMLLLGLFVKMSNGATYAVVPFINKRALGSVSGIVGAGGNAAAVAAGFLFKSSVVSWPTALFILGVIVTLVSVSILAIRFTPQIESEEATPPILTGDEAAPVLPAGVQAVCASV